MKLGEEELVEIPVSESSETSHDCYSEIKVSLDLFSCQLSFFLQLFRFHVLVFVVSFSRMSSDILSPRSAAWKPQFAVCTAKSYAEQARFWLVSEFCSSRFCSLQRCDFGFFLFVDDANRRMPTGLKVVNKQLSRFGNGRI